MARPKLGSFIGWHCDSRGHYCAFTPAPAATEQAPVFECWELARWGMPTADDDEWWEPGWYLFGPNVWGEFMARTLPAAQDAGREYVAARRAPSKPDTGEAGGA